MTEPTNPAATSPAVPNPYGRAAFGPAAVTIAHRGSVLASAIAVFLGGYILVQSLSSQLAATLAGYGPGPDLLPYFLGQTLFGVAAVVVGYFVAPASSASKFIASAIVVVGTIITVASQTARLSSGSGFGGLPVSLTLANQYFMIALLVGAGWLIVRSARVGWLSLLLTLILIPLPFLFQFNGVSFAVTQVVLLIAMGIVGAAILIAGRARPMVAAPHTAAQ